MHQDRVLVLMLKFRDESAIGKRYMHIHTVVLFFVRLPRLDHNKGMVHQDRGSTGLVGVSCDWLVDGWYTRGSA